MTEFRKVPSVPTLRVRKLAYEAISPKARPLGWDLMACLVSESGASRQAVLPPRESRSVPTGIALKPPPGYFCMIVSLREPAKGHSAFWVTDAPQILMPDYDGEVNILLYNGGVSSHYITHGQPIAHLLLMPTMRMTITETP